MMELWVERGAVEVVVRAAIAYGRECNVIDQDMIEGAIGEIARAVEDAWEDPLDIGDAQ